MTWRPMNEAPVIDAEGWKPIDAAPSSGGARQMDEAIRAAEIRGMRRGFEIAKKHAEARMRDGESHGTYPDITWRTAERALEAAVQKGREG
jgi:hypothetical protein